MGEAQASDHHPNREYADYEVTWWMIVFCPAWPLIRMLLIFGDTDGILYASRRGRWLPCSRLDLRSSVCFVVTLLKGSHNVSSFRYDQMCTLLCVVFLRWRALGFFLLFELIKYVPDSAFSFFVVCGV